MKLFRNLVRHTLDEEGTTAIEHALLAALVALAVLFSLVVLGGNLSVTYCQVATHMGGTGNCTIGSGTGGGGGGGGGSGGGMGGGSAGGSGTGGGWFGP